jgi:hypothetical protein
MNKNWKTTSIIALLIALVIHVMAFLYFNISTLEQGSIIIEKDLLLELDFTELDEDPLEEEIVEENNQSLTNLMKDIQNIRNQSYKNYSEAEMDLKDLILVNIQKIKKRRKLPKEKILKLKKEVINLLEVLLFHVMFQEEIAVPISQPMYVKEVEKFM